MESGYVVLFIVFNEYDKFAENAYLLGLDFWEFRLLVFGARIFVLPCFYGFVVGDKSLAM